MGKIYNKDEFVRRMAKKGYTLKDCNQIVDDVFDTICEVLADGDGVMFRGFGCFDVRDRAARTTTSPSTGEKIDIPATRGVHFAVGANLKRYVREGMKAE